MILVMGSMASHSHRACLMVLALVCSSSQLDQGQLQADKEKIVQTDTCAFRPVPANG